MPSDQELMDSMGIDPVGNPRLTPPDASGDDIKEETAPPVQSDEELMASFGIDPVAVPAPDAPDERQLAKLKTGDKPKAKAKPEAATATQELVSSRATLEAEGKALYSKIPEDERNRTTNTPEEEDWLQRWGDQNALEEMETLKQSNDFLRQNPDYASNPQILRRSEEVLRRLRGVVISTGANIFGDQETANITVDQSNQLARFNDLADRHTVFGKVMGPLLGTVGTSLAASTAETVLTGGPLGQAASYALDEMNKGMEEAKDLSPQEQAIHATTKSGIGFFSTLAGGALANKYGVAAGESMIPLVSKVSKNIFSAAGLGKLAVSGSKAAWFEGGEEALQTGLGALNEYASGLRKNLDGLFDETLQAYSIGAVVGSMTEVGGPVLSGLDSKMEHVGRTMEGFVKRLKKGETRAPDAQKAAASNEVKLHPSGTTINTADLDTELEALAHLEIELNEQYASGGGHNLKQSIAERTEALNLADQDLKDLRIERNKWTNMVGRSEDSLKVKNIDKQMEIIQKYRDDVAPKLQDDHAALETWTKEFEDIHREEQSFLASEYNRIADLRELPNASKAVLEKLTKPEPARKGTAKTEGKAKAGEAGTTDTESQPSNDGQPDSKNTKRTDAGGQADIEAASQHAAAVEQHTNEVKTLQSENELVKDETRRITNERASLEAQQAGDVGAVAAGKKEHARQLKKLETQRDTRAARQQKLSEAQALANVQASKVAQTEAAYDAQVAADVAFNEALDAEIAPLRTKVANLAKDRLTLPPTVTTTDAPAVNTDPQLTPARIKKQEAAKTKRAALEARKAAAQKEFDFLESDEGQPKFKEEVTDEDVEANEDLAEAHSEKVAALDEELETLESDITDVNMHLTARQDEIQSARNQLEDEKGEIAFFEGKLADLKAQDLTNLTGPQKATHGRVVDKTQMSLSQARELIPGKIRASEKRLADLLAAETAGPDSDFKTTFLDAVNKSNGNFLSLHELRKAHPELSRKEFDAKLRELRVDGLVSLSIHQNDDDVGTQKQIDILAAGIPDGSKVVEGELPRPPLANAELTTKGKAAAKKNPDATGAVNKRAQASHDADVAEVRAEIAAAKAKLATLSSKPKTTTSSITTTTPADTSKIDAQIAAINAEIREKGKARKTKPAARPKARPPKDLSQNIKAIDLELQTINEQIADLKKNPPSHKGQDVSKRLAEIDARAKELAGRGTALEAEIAKKRTKPPVRGKSQLTDTPIVDAIDNAMLRGRQEDQAATREILGLDKLPKREAQAAQEAFAEANRLGYPSKALDLAKEVLETGRILNSVELAGIQQRYVQELQRFTLVTKKLENDTLTDGEVLRYQSELDESLNNVDVITEAWGKTASEAGAALQAQQRFYGEVYSTQKALTQARRIKGEQLSAKEVKTLTKVSEDVREAAENLLIAEPGTREYDVADMALKDARMQHHAALRNMDPPGFLARAFEGFNALFSGATLGGDGPPLFRQGLETMKTNPFITAKNIKSFYKPFVTNTYENARLEAFKAERTLREMPNFRILQKEYNMPFLDERTAFNDAEGSGQQRMAEALMPGVKDAVVKGIDLQDKIPLTRQLLLTKQRLDLGYRVWLNTTRVTIANNVYEINKDILSQPGGKKEMQTMINNAMEATGHTALAPGTFGRTLFVAPRWLISNVTYPARAMKHMPRGLWDMVHRKQSASRYLGKQYAKSIVGHIALSYAMEGVASIIFGAENVDVDRVPWSPTFGLMRINNTAWDLTGGKGFVFRTAAKLVKGGYEIATGDDGIQDFDFGQTIGGITVTRFNPALRAAGYIFQNAKAIGDREKTGLTEFALRSSTFLSWQAVYDALMDEGLTEAQTSFAMEMHGLNGRPIKKKKSKPSAF